MTHLQALQDYDALQLIAGGDPHDAGEVLEKIADEMLRNPSTKLAKKLLCELVEMFFVQGGPSGDSLKGDPEAQKIFIRHGLGSESDIDA